jgi:hypothetical protein
MSPLLGWRRGWVIIDTRRSYESQGQRNYEDSERNKEFNRDIFQPNNKAQEIYHSFVRG